MKGKKAYGLKEILNIVVWIIFFILLFFAIRFIMEKIFG